MEFNAGDKVRVILADTADTGRVGRITEGGGGAYLVLLAGDEVPSGGYGSELELWDEKREALIELAATLDKARLQANAIDEYVIQSQRGVYGTIALSLHDTLEQIVGAGKDDIFYATADRVYDSVLDGNTIRQALAAVVK